MEAIKIKKAQDTPEVILDKENNTFVMEGKSFPADVGMFYKPIIDWIENYSENPLEKTVFTLKMDYFNTASSKVILDILYKLEDMSMDGHDVLVKWFYPDDDEDMMETGEEYDEIVDVPFELIEYTPEYQD